MPESKVIVRRVVDGIGTQLRDKFEELRPHYYNANTKGAGYEKVLKEVLSDYLDSIVSIHDRCFLIDRNLDLLNTIPYDKNEFDIVATFNSACPKIVFQTDTLKYIPLDAVAFLIEVKQTITKPALKEDLDKMDYISKINTDGRFGVTFTGMYSVSHPMKILAYYDKQIDDKEFFDILIEHLEDWDAILLVEEDILYVNPRLPWVNKILNKFTIEKFHPHALFWIILIISISLTISPMTNTASTFVNMWKSYYKE